MKKIVIINQSQAVYYKALYESLAQYYQVTYITVNKHEKHYKSHRFEKSLVIPKADLVDVHEMKVREVNKVGNLAVHNYSNIIRAQNPDYLIVHETGFFNLHAFLYLWRSKGRAMISTEIGQSNTNLLSAVSKVVRKWVGPRTECVIAHSPAAMKSDLVPGGKTIRAFHAVNAQISSVLKEPDSDLLRLVFLGQVIPRKGLDLFLTILEEIRGEFDFHFTVIGDGEMIWLEDEIKQRGLSEQVTAAGFLEGARQREVIDQHDVFVLPSRYDTYGAVTQEVASRGLALFISKNAGSHVMVEEGVNGYSFNPENVKEAAEMLRKFRDIKKLKSMMAESLRIAEDYSAASSAKRIHDYLENRNT